LGRASLLNAFLECIWLGEGEGDKKKYNKEDFHLL
jgi:hypothetical protein